MIDGDALRQAGVLIIDDDPSNVLLLERLLSHGGFTNVRGITDSRQALAVYDEMRPDLVMLDLHMPYLDGFAVLEALNMRRGPREYLPILVLTADVGREAKERALSGGARDFLTKPLERTEVLLRAKNLLETRFLYRVLEAESQSLEAQVFYHAFHDSLTGLANRAFFRHRSSHALERARQGAGERAAVVLLDLDNFKGVNDMLGHVDGDALLQATAERVRRATRGCDTVARIGGDEFAILLDGMHCDEEALIVIGRLTESMRHPVSLSGRQVVVGVSIGVAFARDQQSIDELLRNADAAMYHAKAAGKGRFAVFSPGMSVEQVERVG